MKLSQHVTYAQYSLLNRNEVMNCNAEPASARAKINPKSWNWEKSHEIG